MYIDPNCEQSDMVDKLYRIIEPMKVRCCGFIIKIGTVVRVCYNTSKKIVLIRDKTNGGYHKVKMSKLNRCSEEINE